eukprot:12902038-Alexandrium_andersonii.AAC.1
MDASRVAFALAQDPARLASRCAACFLSLWPCGSCLRSRYEETFDERLPSDIESESSSETLQVAVDIQDPEGKGANQRSCSYG